MTRPTDVICVTVDEDASVATADIAECPCPMSFSWRPGLLGDLARGYLQRIGIVAIFATVFFAIDQASKLVAAVFPPDHFVKNAAVGLPIWAALVPIVVVSLFPHRLLLLCGGILVGGTLGNAVDVAFWPGGVPDFINAPYPFSPPSIWNFADAFIDIGALLFVLSFLVIVTRRMLLMRRDMLARAAAPVV